MKISVSNIPGYYPNDFYGQLYLNVRSVRKGFDSVITETTEKHQVVNDEQYRIRKIQTAFYDKYTIEFITTESISVELLDIAGEVIITQDNGEEHLANIIDFAEPEVLQNSEFRLYTITYQDLNSKEVINHLTYDSDINSDYIVQLDYVSDGSGNPVESLYTPVYPIFSVSDYEIEENDDNSVKKRSFENAFRTVQILMFLDADDKNSLLRSINQKHLNMSAGVGFDNGVVIKYDGTDYEALEVPEILVEDSELEGIYPVIMTLRYEQILNFPYDE